MESIIPESAEPIKALDTIPDCQLFYNGAFYQKPQIEEPVPYPKRERETKPILVSPQPPKRPKAPPATR